MAHIGSSYARSNYNYSNYGNYGNYGYQNRGHYGRNHGYSRYTSTFRTSGRGARSGFMVDLDGDGRMTRGRDGVLAFDMNRDGRISSKEIKRSKNQLELLTGTHKDLRSKSPCKRARAKRYRKKLLKRFDINRDGKISNFELRRKGGRMLVDSNHNGRYEAHESQSLRGVHTRSGSFRLNMLSRNHGSASVTQFGHRPSWGRFSMF